MWCAGAVCLFSVPEVASTVDATTTGMLHKLLVNYTDCRAVALCLNDVVWWCG